MTDRWRQILDSAIANDPRGRAGVAEKLGLSRSAISQVVTGSYPARTDRIAAAVMARYDRYRCPHLERDLSAADCIGYALRSCPTTSPREVRHWRACQACPHKPKEPS